MVRKHSEREEPALVEPAEAALKLQRLFRKAVRRLRRSDFHLQADMVQEMSLAVLECSGRHPLSLYFSRGVSRAISFLRMWTRGSDRHEPIEDHYETFWYDPVEIAARRDAAISELKRRGMGFLLEELYELEATAAEAARSAA